MDGLVKVQNKAGGIIPYQRTNMNSQQLFKIEQHIQHNDMLLHHFPTDTFKACVKEHAALLQANDDLHTLIHEVKMTKKSIRVEVDDELHQRVRYKALAMGTTVAAVIRQKLHDWVEKEKPIVLLPTDEPPPNKSA